MFNIISHQMTANQNHNEILLHTHKDDYNQNDVNGLLLSDKKKQNWVTCSEVDGPRVCHREWSKSERKK